MFFAIVFTVAMIYIFTFFARGDELRAAITRLVSPSAPTGLFWY